MRFAARLKQMYIHIYVQDVPRGSAKLVESVPWVI